MQAILFDEYYLDGDDVSDLYLEHIGTPHEGNIPHSGRYPYGSGDHAMQRAYTFRDKYNQLKKVKGLSEKEIAAELGVVDRFGKPDVNRLRARYSNTTNDIKAYERSLANHLYYDECNENASEVARRLGKSESTIRSYLDAERTDRVNLTRKTADLLKDYIDENKYVDVSTGTNIYLGVTESRMDNAVAALEEEGYKKQTLYIDQLGTNHKTTMTVLTRPDVDYAELSENRYDVRFLGQDSRVIDECGDVLKVGMDRPVPVSSDRIYIRYNTGEGDDSGLVRDGLIELRPGVKDLSLGGADYAQVRINVDDSHYLKGMARYSDDIPDGYDIVVNSNKKPGTPAKAEDPDDPKAKQVFKTMQKVDGEVDWSNPFGSGSLTQIRDGDGNLSACNVVRTEGEWQTWDRNLPSQFLSKQPVPLAERQLKLAADDKKRELEEINALTNPEVKKKFLLDFADKCDSAAVELKAAPFPGQQTHVLLPFPEVKDNEIYAPNYPDGTTVALVRFPHQGKFEIPILTVHNTGSPVKDKLGVVPDAVGINHTVADRLSGADFDGDTVLVIPLSDRVKVQSQNQLDGLKGFDPKERYPYHEGMNVMSERVKEQQMGVVSNLITDMTIGGATSDELARATRHALVVIDAAKHKLDWKASEEIEHLDDLKAKYQNGGGASTIISRASSEERVNERKEWFPSTTSIGPNGEKIYRETGEMSLRGRLKGIPMKDGTLVNVKEERKGGEKTGRLYYTKEDPATGKQVRTYVTKDDFPDDIEKLKEQRNVYLNKDNKTGAYYYLQTDKATGKKVRAYVTEDDLDGGIKEVARSTKTTKMAKAEDAYALTSGGSKENVKYPIEEKYAEYANTMKALANMARKEYLATPTYKRDVGASQEYKEELESLDKKLLAVKSNAPLERQAQLLGNRQVALAKEKDPNMSKEKLKKTQGRMITAAREALKTQRKDKIKLTEREVEAIQKNAISATKLRAIMDKCDTDDLRKNFTPRAQKTITPSMEALAKSMYASGYTYAQISERLGVSTTTANRIISGKEAS